MVKVTKCPACGSSNLNILKRHQFKAPSEIKSESLPVDIDYVNERLWIFFKKIYTDKNIAEIEATLCEYCGLIFTNPRFSERDINTKYETIDKLESARKRGKDNPAFRTRGRGERILNLLAPLYSETNKKGKVLDYGGAEGYNLIPFATAGYSCYLVDYIQFDPREDIEYLGKNLDDLSSDDTFDIILLCHTLEHVINPQEMIEALTHHLSENGLLYVEVPLGAWLEWDKLKEPLTHINFFSEESLYRAFKRAGLNIMHLSTKYQWVTHRKNLCINIVGTKNNKNSINNYKTTKTQMSNPFYYFKPLIDSPGYYIPKTIRKYWDIFLNKITKK
jgi:2-polyprenyl-3-methyl-5-hydroxy-6-metoxy-1,4-benzoquinol methylase